MAVSNSCQGHSHVSANNKCDHSFSIIRKQELQVHLAATFRVFPFKKSDSY